MIFYYGLMQARLTTLFYTENMIQLRITRELIKKQLIVIVEKFGPTLSPDFVTIRKLRDMGMLQSDDDLKLSRKISEIDQKSIQIELDTAFESLQELGI